MNRDKDSDNGFVAKGARIVVKDDVALQAAQKKLVGKLIDVISPFENELGTLDEDDS